MTDFTKILDKAKELEAKMKESQEKIKDIKAEGVSGSNSVKIVLDGEGEMHNIELSDELLKEDKTIVEDLIVAAHNSAKSQLKSKTTEEISKAAGGFGIPFFLQNLLPVIFKMKNTNYFFASFLGFIPGFFIWNTIGAGVNTFIKEADEFSIFNLILSDEIYIPVLIFIGLILSSLIVKKKFFND